MFSRKIQTTSTASRKQLRALLSIEKNAEALHRLPKHLQKNARRAIAAALGARSTANHHSRKVGAAVYTSNGNLFWGSNLKPIKGSKTRIRFCAETTAANTAHTHGELEDIELLVTASNIYSKHDADGIINLCDVCMEYFHTIFPEQQDQIWVIIVNTDSNELRVQTLEELQAA